jgi:hypothetical protein
MYVERLKLINYCLFGVGTMPYLNNTMRTIVSTTTGNNTFSALHDLAICLFTTKRQIKIIYETKKFSNAYVMAELYLTYSDSNTREYNH